MVDSQYIFQRKRASFAKRIFTKGLNAAGAILLYLAEIGEGFLEDLPSCYPQFDLMKQLAGVGPYRKSRREWLKKKNLQNALYRLKKKGLVVKDPKRKIYYLTKKGKKIASYIEDRYGLLARKWDGKIRVVIFDIPEKKKKWREWLRAELLLLQYKELQKSVYIGKAPLPESLYQQIIQDDLQDNVFVFTMSEFDRKRIKEILSEK
jgi:CRISPR/Cas system-associated endoribonuclease Cas2